MTLIDAADYEAVRKAIEISLDEDDLPGSVIGLPIYQGEAEREVLGLVPTAQTEVDGTAGVPTASGQLIKLATVYLTAARLAPRVESIKSVKYPDYAEDRTVVDRDTQVAQLRTMAFSLIDTVLGITPSAALVSNVPIMFSKARGGRGVF